MSVGTQPGFYIPRNAPKLPEPNELPQCAISPKFLSSPPSHSVSQGAHIYRHPCLCTPRPPVFSSVSHLCSLSGQCVTWLLCPCVAQNELFLHS